MQQQCRCSFTLSKVWEMYVSAETVMLSDHTITVYQQSLHTLIQTVGDVEICQLTRNHMEQWRTSLMSERVLYENHPWRKPKRGRLSVHTVRKHMGHVSRIFNWAVDHDEIECVNRSPLAKVRRPAEPDAPPRGTDKNTINRVIDAIKSAKYANTPVKDRPLVIARNIAIVHTLRSTAARIAGVYRLSLDDLILMDGQYEALFLEKGRHGGQQVWRFWDGDATQALEAWLALHPVRTTQGEGGSLPLFVSLRGDQFGKRLSIHGIRHVLKLARINGQIIRPTNPHSFRHHRVTQWDEELGTGAAMQLAGHKDMRSTLRYARHNRARLRKMSRRLE